MVKPTHRRLSSDSPCRNNRCARHFRPSSHTGTVASPCFAGPFGNLFCICEPNAGRSAAKLRQLRICPSTRSLTWPALSICTMWPACSITSAFAASPRAPACFAGITRSFAPQAASSSGYAIGLGVHEIGLSGSVGLSQRSSPTGSYVMATVEHREPCESRGSRTVLGARGGEIPPRDSTRAAIALTRGVVRSAPNLGHWLSRLARQLRATCGLMQCSKEHPSR